jgi:hypothetical protein
MATGYAITEIPEYCYRAKQQVCGLGKASKQNNGQTNLFNMSLSTEGNVVPYRSLEARSGLAG